MLLPFSFIEFKFRSFRISWRYPWHVKQVCLVNGFHDKYFVTVSNRLFCFDKKVTQIFPNQNWVEWSCFDKKVTKIFPNQNWMKLFRQKRHKNIPKSRLTWMKGWGWVKKKKITSDKTPSLSMKQITVVFDNTWMSLALKGETKLFFL